MDACNAIGPTQRQCSFMNTAANLFLTLDLNEKNAMPIKDGDFLNKSGETF
jgi:hypothetical protein